MRDFNSNHWAVILGGSSGFGLATAKKLGSHGMNLFIVHRDRRGAMARIEKEFLEIKNNCNVQFVSLNVNALTDDGRAQILQTVKEKLGATGKVRLLLHSIAFGNLRPVAPSTKDTTVEVAIAKLAQKLGATPESIDQAISSLIEEGVSPLHTMHSSSFGDSLLGDEDMKHTIYNMGSSLLSWVQDLFGSDLFASDARVVGLTSEGNEVAWRGYAAVAAAKAVLESISRSIAVEFAPFGIRSNVVQPGVTPTPALKLIPGHDKMEAVAKLRNPFKRTTTPEDVANVIALLCTDEASWINGSLIRVDGGEHISPL
ncbi:MAG: SDR family oxidoreductase [Bacteriovoracaceae bacterium]|nr:SDR family oxidoreductase [Bacteriovoracaceae bacterium]